ncbi:GAG-pre-integrase domain-containing protein [Aspergillus novofumigatus IBT 16806]|uniref:GAG-pre-integrase domain-containing protein n=1 Tax=Aspergillus novofumigatus (strain IBT 16806) TaxID=1392255 RepID=A0A2I1C3R1_ASPN1|nr:uncharacterized protein P174DRAFT_504492 [Aspergillus novofumigatus IBT 16806]PKX92272.1 hypothetical protein P174DRAFT_504492 [Aspergillus novofumigatus IBT 16806]
MVGWHQRLCHISFRDVLKLANTGTIRITGSKTMPFCDTGKRCKRSIPSTAAQRAVKPLARIHIDIAGDGSSLGCSDEDPPAEKTTSTQNKFLNFSPKPRSFELKIRPVSHDDDSYQLSLFL